MKPKHQVFCPELGRKKLLFESEAKADRYLEFNKSEIQAENGYAPERCYYCVLCGGWHTTSMSNAPKNYSRTESIVNAHKKSLAQREKKAKRDSNGLAKRERDAQALIELLDEKTKALHNINLDRETAHEHLKTCQLALKRLRRLKGLHGVDLKIYEFEAKVMKLKKFHK